MTDNNLEALKPCPFCGSDDVAMISAGPGNHFVKCNRCSISTDDTSQERAVTAWNTRTSPPAGSDAVDPAILQDPTAVHVNMLRGGIAKPSVRAIWHIYGQALLDEAPADVLAALSDGREASGEVIQAVDYRAEFEAAMLARDEAGFLGTSPAETIQRLSEELQDSRLAVSPRVDGEAGDV